MLFLWNMSLFIWCIIGNPELQFVSTSRGRISGLCCSRPTNAHTDTLAHTHTLKTPLCTDLLTHSERQCIQWFWFHGFHLLVLAGNAGWKDVSIHLVSSLTPRMWPPESTAKQCWNYRKGTWLGHVRTSTGFVRQALVSVEKIPSRGTWTLTACF